MDGVFIVSAVFALAGSMIIESFGVGWLLGGGYLLGNLVFDVLRFGQSTHRSRFGIICALRGKVAIRSKGKKFVHPPTARNPRTLE